MCMLCFMNPLFQPPKDPGTDLNEMRKHAARLKEDLRIFELESESRRKNGIDPCAMTEKRIGELREEMFKLARKM
jgi:hypothetical protein